MATCPLTVAAQVIEGKELANNAFIPIITIKDMMVRIEALFIKSPSSLFLFSPLMMKEGLVFENHKQLDFF
jgi:hypothetical protein